MGHFYKHLVCGLLAALAPWSLSAAEKPSLQGITLTSSDNGEVTAKVTARSGGAETTVSFRYSSAKAAEKIVTASPKVGATDPSTEVSVKVTGLIGGQTYHFTAEANNSAGSAVRLTATVEVRAYKPTLTALSPSGFHRNAPAPPAPSPATDEFGTLRGKLTANGKSGSAYFEYGLLNTYGASTKENATTISGSDIDKIITAPDLLFEHGKVHHFRVVFQDETEGAPTFGIDTTFIANANPHAVDDTVVAGGRGPTAINVLSNDTDPDRDKPKVIAVTEPEHGTATMNETGKVSYTPGADFEGFDSFEYTVEDDADGIASATVTIYNPRVAAAGAHATLLKDLDGNTAGYLQIVALQSGGLTGKLKIGDNTYTLVGYLDANGHFHGQAVGGGKARTVDLTVVQGSETASLDVKIDGGWLTGAMPARAPAEDLTTLPGRYTVTLPPGSGRTDTADTVVGNAGTTTSSGTVPGGDGWAGITVFPDGTARLKGKLGDGRGFSMSGVLSAAEDGVVLDIYANPGEKARLAGTLTMGETITGSLEWTRRESGTRFYGDGFSLTLSASGGRYTPPADGERAFGASHGTITLTGGELRTFTHQLRFSEDEDVRVNDANDDELKLKLSRDSGIFTGAFQHPDDRERHRFSGVLLNSAASGSGVFLGRDTAGKVQLSTGSGIGTPIVPSQPLPSLERSGLPGNQR